MKQQNFQNILNYPTMIRCTIFSMSLWTENKYTKVLNDAEHEKDVFGWDLQTLKNTILLAINYCAVASVMPGRCAIDVHLYYFSMFRQIQSTVSNTIRFFWKVLVLYTPRWKSLSASMNIPCVASIIRPPGSLYATSKLLVRRKNFGGLIQLMRANPH